MNGMRSLLACLLLQTGAAHAGGAFVAGHSTPGSPDYPNEGMMPVGALTGSPTEQSISCGAMDSQKGYAYFGTSTTPAQVVKVATGSGAELPERIAALRLEEGENDLRCGALDPSAGYAYFATNTSPGRIVKIGLGEGDAAPRRVAALTLAEGENGPGSVAMDAAAGYAYFGTLRSPGRVVKVALGSGDDPPTRIGAITLQTGENLLTSAVIDPAAGCALFGTNTLPARIVKVALGTGDALPTRIGARTLSSGENYALCGVFDPVAKRAYFGTYTSVNLNLVPARAVMIDPGAGNALPVRVGSVPLSDVTTVPTCAAIDPASRRLYFCTRRHDLSPAGAKVVPLAIGDGSALPIPQTAGNLYEEGVTDWFVANSMDIDADGHGVFGGPWIVKSTLGDGATPPARIGKEELHGSEGGFEVTLVDSAAGYGYVGTTVEPARVIKFSLGSGDAAPTRLGATSLESGADSVACGVIDTAGGHAYFGIDSSPGGVVKVALGEGDDLPVRIGAATFEPGENLPVSAVMDAEDGYAYFGMSTNPARVAKVALGGEGEAPSRVGGVQLTGLSGATSAVVDSDAGYAYFGTWSSTALIAKVALGEGDAPPVFLGAISLENGESWLQAAAIDPEGGHAYFGTGLGSPARIVKIALGAGDALPTRVGALVMESTATHLGTMAIDPAGENLYLGFGTSTSAYSPAAYTIARVGTGIGSLPPFRRGTGTLIHGGCISSAMDASGGHVYFGTYPESGGLTKVAFGKGRSAALNLTSVELEDIAQIRDVRFHSHAAEGNLRLAIFDDERPRRLLWESGSVANTTADGEVFVPISDGFPPLLALEPETYWLAWQTDTSAAVGSLTPAADSSDGMIYPHPFGPAPSELLQSNVAYAPETWTIYLTYDLAGSVWSIR